MSKLKAPVFKTQSPERLPWPSHPKDLSTKPRSFRIERLSAFEWQAFVTDVNGEKPIGKPDIFDLVKHRVSSVIRAEGQMAFLDDKKKKTEAQEAAHRAKALVDSKASNVAKV